MSEADNPAAKQVDRSTRCMSYAVVHAVFGVSHRRKVHGCVHPASLRSVSLPFDNGVSKLAAI
eukprot:254943-Amphidinium_carterae.1